MKNYFLYILKGISDEGKSVFLTDFVGYTLSGVRNKFYFHILEKNIKGTVDSNFKKFGYKIVKIKIKEIK